MRIQVNTYTQFGWQVLENKNVFSDLRLVFRYKYYYFITEFICKKLNLSILAPSLYTVYFCSSILERPRQLIPLPKKLKDVLNPLRETVGIFAIATSYRISFMQKT